MNRSELSGRERECLRQCAHHHAMMDMPLDSDDAMLHLLELGLIERVPQVRAPVEAMRFGYRLTELGWSVYRKIQR